MFSKNLDHGLQRKYGTDLLAHMAQLEYSTIILKVAENDGHGMGKKKI